MAKFLTTAECKKLEKLIDLTIEETDQRGPAYLALYAAYNGFEPSSNSAASIAAIVAAIDPVNRPRADDIRGWVFIKIRQNNYPSNWDLPSQQARDAFRLGNPGSSAVFWQCPGQGLTVAHDAALNDITIDHVIPVAVHWNAYGCDTDGISRKNWYWDITNHAYLCGPCNSARGSGGVLYNMFTGLNYSN
jgi:5-methylcytosine-specific restriction endonuclease McrA